MIDFWKVLTALKEYYSPEGSDSELLPLCKAGASEIQARLKENADPDDIRIINAAAAIANYRICMKKIASSDGTESFLPNANIFLAAFVAAVAIFAALLPLLKMLKTERKDYAE